MITKILRSTVLTAWRIVLGLALVYVAFEVVIRELDR